MGDHASRTALVVVVPESERVVAAHRLRLDRNAAAGVPAHVTVLFPFLPPAEVGPSELDRLGAVFASIPAFDYRFERTSWFGDDVLWLAPVDPDPFVVLTRRVYAAFPDHPPFEGRFGDSVPHLTIGHGQSRARLEQAERVVLPLLPVVGAAAVVSLLAQDLDSGSWSVRHTFALA